MEFQLLEQKIKDFQTTHEALKAPGANGEFAAKAGQAANAAQGVVNEAGAIESTPTVLKEWYIGLWQASEGLQKSLKADGAYDAAAKAALRDAADQFSCAATRFSDRVAMLNSFSAAPLLPEKAETWVGWASLGLLLVAVILGIAGRWAGTTAAAVWPACGAIALGGIWLLGRLSRSGPFQVFSGSKAAAPLQYLVFGGMAFMVLGLLAVGIFNNKGGLLDSLTVIPSARGLITFLIAIGTIAIAVILSLASVLMEANDVESLKVRLSQGKDILTVLVGVLGTIVGFYFANNPGGDTPGKMTVAVIERPNSVEAGTPFDLQAMTSGGEMPYDPTPIFSAEKGIEGEGSVNEQGLIKVHVTTPMNLTATSIPLVIGLRDKQGRTATTKLELKVSKP